MLPGPEFIAEFVMETFENYPKCFHELLLVVFRDNFYEILAEDPGISSQEF